MEINQILKDLGLQDKEPHVFLALLKTAGFQPASVIADKANVNRTTAYKTLLNLSKIGLVTKTMRYGITCFAAEDPEHSLTQIAENKKARVDRLIQDVASVLPQLQAIQKQENFLPKVRYYESLEGLKKVYNDTIAANETIYAFEDFSHFPSDLKTWVFEDYIPRRVRHGIYAQVLTPKNGDNVDYRQKDESCHKETRFIPKSIFSIENEINIYGKKIAFFSFKQEEMFAIILESQTISSSMRSIFNICWSIAK